MNHIEKLIDILVRNTGGISPEEIKVFVLNCTALIREMPKCGLMLIFFPKCIQRLHPVLIYFVSNKEL